MTRFYFSLSYSGILSKSLTHLLSVCSGALLAMHRPWCVFPEKEFDASECQKVDVSDEIEGFACE